MCCAALPNLLRFERICELALRPSHLFIMHVALQRRLHGLVLAMGRV
jgi:hypothetical protein